MSGKNFKYNGRPDVSYCPPPERWLLEAPKVGPEEREKNQNKKKGREAESDENTSAAEERAPVNANTVSQGCLDWINAAAAAVNTPDGGRASRPSSAECVNSGFVSEPPRRQSRRTRRTESDADQLPRSAVGSIKPDLYDRPPSCSRLAVCPFSFTSSLACIFGFGFLFFCTMKFSGWHSLLLPL